MTPERYTQLKDHRTGFTLEEMEEGWHYCDDWDGLLVGPGMLEFISCTCFDRICPSCED